MASNDELIVEGFQLDTAAPGVAYEVQGSNHWSYSAGTDTSAWTNGNAVMRSWMKGWLFTPNVNKPCYLPIVAVNESTDAITVQGNATGLEVTPVDAWRVHAPPGVDPTTGALITDLTAAGSMYLCADLRYMPPQAGFEVSGTTYGAQPGVNLSGTHYNGGVFDPDTGVQFQEGEKKPGRVRADWSPPQNQEVL